MVGFMQCTNAGMQECTNAELPFLPFLPFLAFLAFLAFLHSCIPAFFNTAARW
jgi:hypothetical protein